MLGVGAGGPLGASSVLETWSPAVPVGEDPPAPIAEPTRAAERDAWAILAAVDGLGPIGFSALLTRYGHAQAILDDAARPGAVARLAATPPQERSDDRPLRRPIAHNVASAIVDGVQAGAQVLRRIRELDIAIVTLDEPAYPARLAGVALPPHVLFVTGAVTAISPERAVAVVGTRGATTAGRTIAARLAYALVAADAAVVSGLAYGIDGAAHEATVRAGGVTIAVIGGGHARMGPRGHARLADAILAAGGAIVSEHAPDVAPTQGTFPRRNRIISGLASATIVVEAPASSGALITASWALEQGRECYVVPGPLGAPASEGCLALLREFGGAVRVVAGIPQLIADLGFASPARARSPGTAPSAEVAAAALGGLGTTERAVAYQVLAGRTTVDEVVASTDLSVAAVLATLALLERRGLVAGRHGRYRPSGSLLGVVPLPRPR